MNEWSTIWDDVACPYDEDRWEERFRGKKILVANSVHYQQACMCDPLEVKVPRVPDSGEKLSDIIKRKNDSSKAPTAWSFQLLFSGIFALCSLGLLITARQTGPLHGVQLGIAFLLGLGSFGFLTSVIARASVVSQSPLIRFLERIRIYLADEDNQPCS